MAAEPWLPRNALPHKSCLNTYCCHVTLVGSPLKQFHQLNIGRDLFSHHSVKEIWCLLQRAGGVSGTSLHSWVRTTWSLVWRPWWTRGKSRLPRAGPHMPWEDKPWNQNFINCPVNLTKKIASRAAEPSTAHWLLANSLQVNFWKWQWFIFSWAPLSQQLRGPNYPLM